MSDNFLEIKGITKTYGRYKALDNLSVVVPQGKIFGLLGPNGAGKTTLIRTLTGIIPIENGHILFEGENMTNKHHNLIGYLPEERGLYPKMKVGDHISYLAALKSVVGKQYKEKLKYWVEAFGINTWKDKKINELSKGMQQKVQFICAVIHSPKLLILDEPFSGFDPVNASLLKNEILALVKRGTTILFSTHRMEQVEEICDSCILINKGRKILEGKVSNIKRQYNKNEYLIKSNKALNTEALNLTKSVRPIDDGWVIRLADGVQTNDFLHSIMADGAIIHNFTELLPSMHDIFVETVKQVENQSDNVVEYQIPNPQK